MNRNSDLLKINFKKFYILLDIIFSVIKKMIIESKIPFKKGRKFLIEEIYKYRPNPNVDIFEILFKFNNKLIGDNKSSKNFDIYDFEYDCTQFISDDPDLYEMAKKLVVIRYKIEEFGKIKLESFLIIDISGFIYYSGHLKGIELLKKYFTREIYDISYVPRGISFFFQPGFLLWILLKYTEKGFELKKNFLIMKAQRTKIKRTKIKRTSQAKTPVPILMAILLELEIDYSFVLNYTGYKLEIDIHNMKSIGIRTTIYIQHYEPLERFIIAMYIINNLIQVQNQWMQPNSIMNREFEKINMKKLKDECKGKLDLKLYTNQINNLFKPIKERQKEPEEYIGKKVEIKAPKRSKSKLKENTDKIKSKKEPELKKINKVDIKKKVKKETPEQRESRLKKNIERYRIMIANETPEQKELRLKKIREYFKNKKANETPEQKELRKKKTREYDKRRMANETPEQKQKRFALSKKRYYKQRIEKNLHYNELIDYIGLRLNLPLDVIERAKSLFNIILGTYWAGRKKPIILALICVYQAFNEANYTITIRSLIANYAKSEQINKPYRKMYSYYLEFIEILNLPEVHPSKK